MVYFFRAYGNIVENYRISFIFWARDTFFVKGMRDSKYNQWMRALGISILLR